MNEEVIIRHCDIADIDAVMMFIRDHWDENHIFAKNRSFLEYQHLVNGKFTFIIGEGRTSKKVYGIKGYIESNRTDAPDIWGAIWKTIKSPNIMLGIDLRTFFHETVRHRTGMGVGLSKSALRSDVLIPNIHARELPHYYRLTDRPGYRVAAITTKHILPVQPDHLKLRRIRSFDEIKNNFDAEGFRERKPYKDLWYIERRYFSHPIYDYLVYGLYTEHGQLSSLLFCRAQAHKGAKVLRVVDYIGYDDDLAGIATQFDAMLNSEDYEYADLYCYGIDKKVIHDFGFIAKDSDDPNIIPNYFEPFVQKNIQMFFSTTDLDNFYVFRADGDQDRPNTTG